MSNRRRHRALVAAPALVAASAALGLWAWRRWGYPVRSETREVDHVPGPPVDPPQRSPGRAPVQPEAEGVGPRFHRRYTVDVAESTQTPVELMAAIGADVQRFVPAELAVFEKTAGEPGRLAVGDEFDIEIRAPWDGPVRVVEAEPTRFTLATLEGHLEAGQIRFQAQDHPSEPRALRFTIESWARSADPAVDLAYDTVGVAKGAQQAMWTFFCKRVVEDCGGERIGEVQVTTERGADPDEATTDADDGD